MKIDAATDAELSTYDGPSAAALVAVLQDRLAHLVELDHDRGRLRWRSIEIVAIRIATRLIVDRWPVAPSDVDDVRTDHLSDRIAGRARKENKR